MRDSTVVGWGRTHYNSNGQLEVGISRAMQENWKPLISIMYMYVLVGTWSCLGDAAEISFPHFPMEHLRPILPKAEVNALRYFFYVRILETHTVIALQGHR